MTFFFFGFCCVAVGVGVIVLFSRGRIGSVDYRRRTDRRVRFRHGRDRYVDQRRARVIRPTRSVVTNPVPLSPTRSSRFSLLF